MTAMEVTEQTARIEKFQRLKQQAGFARAVIDAMALPKVNGSGPFTGNTRETRRVQSLTVYLSPTLGTAPAVTVELKGLNISATRFGEFLRGELNVQLERIQAEIDMT